MQITIQPKLKKNDWRPLGTDKVLDSDVIENADRVSIRLDNPGAEDALLAAGMALAEGVPATIQAPDRSHLPWFLRDADMSYPGLVTIVESSESTKSEEAPDPAVYKSQKHDTFIGCLMSGLSETEYSEGRSHLIAINDTLREKLDSESNFCEGINIGTNQSFGTPKEALVVDLEAIKGSERCVFYQYDNQSRPSGMWVELGAALAWGKPCTLFTPNLDGVPPSVRKGLGELKVVEYGTHENFKKTLAEKPHSLLNQ